MVPNQLSATNASVLYEYVESMLMVAYEESRNTPYFRIVVSFGIRVGKNKKSRVDEAHGCPTKLICKEE